VHIRSVLISQLAVDLRLSYRDRTARIENPMTPEELLKEGRLEETLKSLQHVVRDDPANPKPRVFLFQLFSILGDWNRANTQLQILADMDADSMMLSRIFTPVLPCEAIRREVFAGKRTPIIFGEPPEWVGSLAEAMAFFGRGEYGAGAKLRDRAFEMAPTSAGKVNGEPFEWIADADERLGPVLEVILEGHYYWVPFCRIRQIFIEPVTDLRDLVWVPAQFVWENAGQASGHIPARYANTENAPENSLKLARKTEWFDRGGVHTGLGQRVLATDANEYPLLEIRTIEFNLPATTAAEIAESKS
jgi:type VI secretion system protein ImpE